MPVSPPQASVRPQGRLAASAPDFHWTNLLLHLGNAAGLLLLPRPPLGPLHYFDGLQLQTAFAL